MKNKVVKNIVKFLAMFVCMFMLTSFLTGCSFGKTNNSYSVSGYVFDELGNPVENVTITSELGEVLTGSDGKYTISGITSSIIVEPSIKGYYFEIASKKITSKNDDASFVASKEYTIEGFTHSNNVPIQNVTVHLNSLAGNFVTQSDETGKFVATGVAGLTTINCSIAGVDFFETSTTIDNPYVSVNSSSSFTLKLSTDDASIDYSKISLKVNDTLVPVVENTTILSSIKCGTTFELVSDFYRFSKTKFTATKLDQVEEIVANKIYSVSGVVKSGETKLNGAEVYLSNKLVATTDQNGLFEIGNLTSSNQISVSYSNLNFGFKNIDSSMTSVEFNGTKPVSVELSFDEFVGDSFQVAQKQTSKKSNTVYLVEDVALGETIELSSEKYHLESNNIVVGNSDFYQINCQALYNATVSIDANFEYELLLDGQTISQNDLSALYGEHTVSARYLNYLFNWAEININNHVVEIAYQQPYNKTVIVKSGELQLLNATLLIENNIFEANQAGEIVLENLVGSCNATVVCEGYNNCNLQISESGEPIINVNLTYNVSGVVKTGNITVSMATVSVEGTTVKTNALGEFSFENLSGEHNIVVSKDYFTFNTTAVSSENEITVLGKYKIFGILSDENDVIAGKEVCLRNPNDLSFLDTKTTDSNGYFEFNDLEGKFWLYTEGLNPESYTVSDGGKYDFSLRGYKIAGYVKTGGIPIEGAYVTAGSHSTYTDENGYYSFELLTDDCTVMVSKTGYNFGAGESVNSNNLELDFEGTYTVSGIVSSAELKIADVAVLVNGTKLTQTDAQGKFEIAGQSGEIDLSFEKQGFVFEHTTYTVSAYSNLSVECSAVKLVVVKSGDLPVTDFDYYINDSFVGHSTSNEINVTAKYGDKVTIQKTGYNFDILTITEEQTFDINASYNVSGKVLSSSVPLSNVTLNVQGKTIQTDFAGGFTITNLIGSTTLVARLTGFNDKSVELAGYQTNLQIDLTYNISGTIFVGLSPLAGVSVTLGNQVEISDENGDFSFSNISGNYSLTFSEKEGYQIDAIENRFGAAKLKVSAKFKISGTVKSGNVPVSLADIELNLDNGETRYTKSDEKGKFEFFGVSGKASVSVSKDGYDASLPISNIDNYTTNANFNLSYSVTINLATTNVKIYIDDVYVETVLSNSITYNNRYGEFVIRFEKDNTKFTPSSIPVSEPMKTTLSIELYYMVYGYVKTDGGADSIGIPNVELNFGTTKTKTNQDGYYIFENVVGTDLTFVNTDLSTESRKIKANGEQNFTVSNKNYGYYLYTAAIENLNSASSVQIIGDGEVKGKGGMLGINIETTQYVHAVFKRDSKGNIMKQNLNFGDEAAGVDPKVSLVVVYDKAQNKTLHSELRKGEVTSKTTANHTVAGLSDSMSADQISQKYGALPAMYSPYSISLSNISVGKITKNSSNNYCFTMTLSTSQPNYRLQILALAPPDTSFNTFESVVFNVEIDQNGWLVKIQAIEKYYIHQKVDVTVNSNVTYNYLTRNKNTTIPNLDWSTDANLNASLLQSDQSTPAQAMAKYEGLNLINNLIYKNSKGGAI